MKKSLTNFAFKVDRSSRSKIKRANADVFDRSISDVGMAEVQVDLVSHKIEDSDINITDWIGNRTIPEESTKHIAFDQPYKNFTFKPKRDKRQRSSDCKYS